MAKLATLFKAEIHHMHLQFGFALDQTGFHSSLFVNSHSIRSFQVRLSGHSRYTTILFLQDTEVVTRQFTIG